MRTIFNSRARARVIGPIGGGILWAEVDAGDEMGPSGGVGAWASVGPGDGAMLGGGGAMGLMSSSKNARLHANGSNRAHLEPFALIWCSFVQNGLGTVVSQLL